MCLLFRGSTVHKEEDKLYIVDKMAGPNVSFIQRLHCTYKEEDSLYIVDKMAGPNVSFIQRLHCTYKEEDSLYITPCSKFRTPRTHIHIQQTNK